VSKEKVKEGFNNLWSAAKEGDIAGFRRLVINGENIDNVTNDLKRTPLIYAVLHNHFTVIKYIFDRQGDIHKPDIYNKTAYDYAEEKGNPSILK